MKELVKQQCEGVLGYSRLSDQTSADLLVKADRQLWGPVLDCVEQVARLVDEAIRV